MQTVIIDQNGLKYEVTYTLGETESYQKSEDQTSFGFRGFDGDITNQTPAKGYSNQLVYELALVVYRTERKKTVQVDYNLFHCYVRKLEN